MIDLTKLTPAPWSASCDAGAWAVSGPGGWRFIGVSHHPAEPATDECDETDARFIAMARNAMDVMMTHRVFPEFGLGGANGWCVRTHICSHIGPFSDPFSAVLAWNEWYNEQTRTGVGSA